MFRFHTMRGNGHGLLSLENLKLGFLSSIQERRSSSRASGDHCCWEGGERKRRPWVDEACSGVELRNGNILSTSTAVISEQPGYKYMNVAEEHIGRECHLRCQVSVLLSSCISALSVIPACPPQLFILIRQPAVSPRRCTSSKSA